MEVVLKNKLPKLKHGVKIKKLHMRVMINGVERDLVMSESKSDFIHDLSCLFASKNLNKDEYNEMYDFFESRSSYRSELLPYNGFSRDFLKYYNIQEFISQFIVLSLSVSFFSGYNRSIRISRTKDSAASALMLLNWFCFNINYGKVGEKLLIHGNG